MPELSVVIPTMNRLDCLQETVAALRVRRGEPGQVEIVVVDDGSTDGTIDWLREQVRTSDLHVVLGDHGGPARARNRGVKAASGRVVLFLGDDITPAPRLLQEHLEWHRRHPEPEVGVLGFVPWAERMPVTPFVRWLDRRGRQFDWRGLQPGQPVPHDRYYTANVSFKRELLLMEPFDEEFRFAASEDLELGYRLRRHGVRVLYDPEAIGYHYHPMTLASVCSRMIRVGQSNRLMHRKWPELAHRPKPPLPMPVVERLGALAKWAGSFVENRVEVPLLFDLALRCHYWVGYLGP